MVISKIAPSPDAYSLSCRLPHTFMIRSGLKTPTFAIPMPDLAVPYAAPMPADVLVST